MRLFVLVSLIFKLKEGAISVGDFTMIFGAIVTFSDTAQDLLQAILALNIFSGFMTDYRKCMALPEVQETAGTEELCGGNCEIEFKNVWFRYTGVAEDTYALKDINVVLKPKEKISVVGFNGAGKTTIINLLMRFYDPDSGRVLIDGQDIRTIDHETLREKFGVVFQNDFITEGTIADNIRFFRPLEGEDLEKAAQNAQAEFIREKDGQMEATVAVRGNNLSGGQKQRLLIGRALAADPEILILDDASSALDYQTDANLRRALRENYRHTTTVMVAQRVSSLRHADLILVLDDGCVAAQGTHEELLRTCGIYRDVYESQQEGVEDNG